jgi:hypothetical protein
MMHQSNVILGDLGRQLSLIELSLVDPKFSFLVFQRQH